MQVSKLPFTKKITWVMSINDLHDNDNNFGITNNIKI